ncbi:MAG TPA: hypothetical protein VFW06_07435 [Acidimicrobiia bacterium]|nr:hypothetical protein [Acidimicrobiia bacterium]
MIRRGEGWGAPAGGPPDVDAAGDDVALAAALRGATGIGSAPRVRFAATGGSDLARAVGLTGRGAGTSEVTLDALVIAADPTDQEHDEGSDTSDDLAVNAVVVGPPPDRLRWWHRRRPLTVEVEGRILFEGRATTVVVANGQFLRGHDVVPAGHPGDGRLEVQVYALEPGERGPMRRRLPGAAHLPHPRIHTGSGRSVLVRGVRPAALEVDGARRGPVGCLRIVLRPGAYRLLV